MLRSHLEENTLPWKHAAISGWVLDPDRKKMSKSKGNVITPLALLEEHGSDAVRYWAAKGGPGVDTAFDPAQMKLGRRLAIKLLNASKFVLMKSSPTGRVTNPLDRATLLHLADVIHFATADLNEYDYGAALRRTEEFFWWFCDDYIEHVKRRRQSDDEHGISATSSCVVSLSVILRLFAPFLPFVTEEVWSWFHADSVHRQPWPNPSEVRHLIGDAAEDDLRQVRLNATEITAEIRRQRSLQKRPFGVPVKRLQLPDALQDRWRAISADVQAANNASDAAVSFGADYDVEFDSAAS